MHPSPPARARAGWGSRPRTPEPGSVQHRRPGGSWVLPQWEPGSASLHPSVPPSFPPSLPPQHPELQASPHPCRYRAGTKVPVRDQHPGWSQLKREALGVGGAAFSPHAQAEAAMHPQTKGMSILLLPRSCSPRKGCGSPSPGVHRLPSRHSPGAKGGAGPPACISGVRQTLLKEGTPKFKGSLEEPQRQ